MAKSLDLANVKISSIDDSDVMLYIRTIRNGITFIAFSNFAKTTPFSYSEWSAFLHMSERTLQRYKQEKKAFDPIHSERILQIGLLYNFGVEVFGSSEKLNNWLETKNLALGGTKPKELLDNSFGIGLLKDELTRIEQGILA